MTNREKSWMYAYNLEQKRGQGMSKLSVWNKDFYKKLKELNTKRFPSLA